MAEIPHSFVEHKIAIKKRNMLFLVLCTILYTTSYLLKLGYSANINGFEELFNIKHTEAGIVSTVFFISYGVGQFLSAFLCKKYNLRRIIPLALIISSLFNIVLGFTPIFTPIIYLWALNGIVLAALFPSMTRAIAENVDHKYKPKSVIAVGITCPIGTILTYAFTSGFSYLNFFRGFFYLSAVLGIACAIVWYFIYPKAKRNEEDEYVPEPKVEKIKKVNKVNKYIGPFLLTTIVLCFFSLVDAIIRDGILTWLPTILKEQYHMTHAQSTFFTIFLTFGEVGGSFLAIWLDKKLKNYILECLVLFFTSGVFLLIDRLVNVTHPVITIISFSLATFSLVGIVTVICSIYPIYLDKKRNVGLIAGVLKGVGYIGSAIGSFGFGAIAQNYGWNTASLFLLIIIFSISGIGLLYFLITKIIYRKQTKNNS